MIYEPREDSFMAKRYIEGLDLEGKRCLDMGTGSGILAEAMLNAGAEDVVAADINPEASEEVPEEVRFVESDLFENIKGSFDLIVFNPPYLPGNEDIEGFETWRGGEDGTEVICSFLEQSVNYIKSGGKVITVVSDLSNQECIFRENEVNVIESLDLFFETLRLVKLESIGE